MGEADKVLRKFLRVVIVSLPLRDYFLTDRGPFL